MVGRLKQIKGRQDTGVGLFQLHPSLRPPPDKTHCTIIVMVRFCLLEKWCTSFQRCLTSNLCLKLCHLTFNLYNLNIFQTAYFVERAVCN